MMLEKVTRKTRNLRQYIELAEIFGPRALQNERDDAASQFAMMVDGADRGLLVQTVKKYYYGEGSTAAVQFVTGRWFDFLEDTKWDSGRPRGTSPATTRCIIHTYRTERSRLRRQGPHGQCSSGRRSSRHSRVSRLSACCLKK
mmetsp:Transcript_82313/g.246790  ORF Transcript_82313/g.246790 Transcript_82313/m.246790 type:complete len:143 (+) Transcript_82313:475-903(+)